MLSLFSKLHVLNIHIKGEEGVQTGHYFEKINQTAHPFSLETCSRHLLIIPHSFIDEAIKLPAMEYLKLNAKSFEHFSGLQAYEFLLMWAVGAKSVHHAYKDQFVRGQLRSAIREGYDNQDILNILRVLSEDSTGILDAINRGIFELGITVNQRKESLEEICKACVSMRIQNIKPNYADLQKNQQEVLEKSLQIKLEKCKKSISQLQKIAAKQDELLLPSKRLSDQMPLFRRLEKTFELKLTIHKISTGDKSDTINPSTKASSKL